MGYDRANTYSAVDVDLLLLFDLAPLSANSRVYEALCSNQGRGLHDAIDIGDHHRHRLLLHSGEHRRIRGARAGDQGQAPADD